ncbi:SGNH/GDSL hydrolase family protein [bacterium]|nr:SGNH/GDSL hydrolase family protein [bacterium]
MKRLRLRYAWLAVAAVVVIAVWGRHTSADAADLLDVLLCVALVAGWSWSTLRILDASIGPGTTEKTDNGRHRRRVRFASLGLPAAFLLGGLWEVSASMPLPPGQFVALATAAGGIPGWLLLWAYRKRLRWDWMLAVWPVLALAASEVCALPVAEATQDGIVTIHEAPGPAARSRWNIERHTNLFGQFDSADHVESSHGKPFPLRRRPGERVVVALGSSSTYGQELADPRTQSWPAALQRRFGRAAAVFNAGVGGYNSFQLTVYYRDVVSRLRPDVLVFYYGGNESFGDVGKRLHRRFEQLIDRSGCRDISCRRMVVRYGTTDPTTLALARVLSRSILYRSLARGFVETRSGLENSEKDRRPKRADDPPLMTTEQCVRELVGITRSWGGRTLLVPEIRSGAGYAMLPYHRIERPDLSVAAIMARIGRTEDGAEFLDIRPRFPPERSDEWFADRSTHFNAAGSARLADTIGDELARLRWMDAKDSAAP